MSSRCLDACIVRRGARCAGVLLAVAMSAGAALAAERELRVCADPDNLPYSHADGSGFENRIAQLLAEELGAKLTYQWMPQRRAFLRNTLNAGTCDVVIGVPTAYERVRTTRPYYRSTYVFVTREGEPAIDSFDDPRLKTWKVGVQLVGDDLATTPPGHALAARGIVENVTGFPIYGEHPQAELMIDALARGEIDVALVWGPQGAYFARRKGAKFWIAPVSAPPELATLPFAFSMSMGVRRRDTALKDELDQAIERRRGDFVAILRDYGVPLVDMAVARRGVAGVP